MGFLDGYMLSMLQFGSFDYIMNKELIQRLYKQSTNNCLVACTNKAWAWEEEFAKLIVLECSRIAKLATKEDRVRDAIERNFGIKT